MMRFIGLVVVACLSLQAPTARAADAVARKPNVVLFLVDDMGWMDCGAYGSSYYKTPHIDAFARQAMRFTDAYAMPLCSPTRASILSGQYSSRHGITSAVGHTKPVKAALQKQAPADSALLMPESGSYLEPDQYTLAEALRDAGYRTAHIGKWHLGLTPPHWPEAQGFDVAFHCHPDAGPPGGYFSPYGVLPPGSERPAGTNARHVVGTITDGPDGEYIVDRQAAEAERFIEESKDRPFFLNLWCYGVHGPWGHKRDSTAEFARSGDPRGVQGNPIMASMLQSVDECFGRILAKLDVLGLTDDTIVIFTSDNGGNVHSNSGDGPKGRKREANDAMLSDWRRWAGDRPPTCNAPLRDGKGRLYEGGVRVPLMVRWPRTIAADATSAAVVGCIDIYPTVLDLAGLPVPERQKIDGVSCAPVLRGTGTLERDAYFIWFPHVVPGVSVRQGDWKLIRRFTERPGDYEGVHELFNLAEDLGETKNLAADLPDTVRSLDALIDGFVRDTGALYPLPNPAFTRRAATAAADVSDRGASAVETIEFADLVDATRKGPAADANGARGAAGRRVPIKVHVPVGHGPAPIVLVSHGAGGDWDTHLGQARHLASHGYAVLCLEHVGSNRAMVAGRFQLMKIVEAMTRDADEVLGRPRDAGFAIDRAEEWNRTHDTLRGRLDLGRVGIMGHSFGAFTTLAVCGMRPALDWIVPRVEPGRGLGPDLRDERVRCGVALSPQGVGEPFFIRESFGSLAVPLLGISGTLDRQQGGLPAENRREAFALWPDGPHRLVWLTNARHVDFTDSTGIRRLELPSPTRADVQPVVRAATLLFFDVVLRGSGDAAATITADGLEPFLRGGVTGVEVLAK